MAEIRAYRGVESTNGQKAGLDPQGIEIGACGANTMTKSKYWDHLDYITKQSGHARASRRDEVGDDVIEALAPVLSEALASDAWADVCGSGWYMAACVDAGRLKFRLAVGIPAPLEAAPIRCAVWPANWSHAARLEVDLPTGAGADEKRAAAFAALGGRIHEAGDLERCVAWAWLEGLPG